MKYLRVKNWEKYQHYTDRRPPWIKIYTELLDGDDIQYSLLPDASKLLLIHLWLLASRHENLVPFDQRWLSTRLNVRSRVNIEPLVAAGFVAVVDVADDSICQPDSPDFDASNASISGAFDHISSLSLLCVSVSGVPGAPDFEEIWRRYPRRKGRKAALRHFASSVKTPEDLAAINLALSNYLNSTTVAAGYVQHGSTWFNNWRDWIEPDEVPKAKTASPEARSLRVGSSPPPSVTDARREAWEWVRDAVPPDDTAALAAWGMAPPIVGRIRGSPEEQRRKWHELRDEFDAVEMRGRDRRMEVTK